MLNEERVKHMVKLADYETKRGNEEMKISSYFKKDYISMNTLASLVWMTIAYILCIVAIWLSVREFVTVELTEPQILSLVVLIVGLYLKQSQLIVVIMVLAYLSIVQVSLTLIIAILRVEMLFMLRVELLT